MNRITNITPLFGIFLFAISLHADEGQPIAIRHWPGDGFTIETMWDLHVGTGLNEEAKAAIPRAVDIEADGADVTKPMILSRKPNEESASTVSGTESIDDKNQILISPAELVVDGVKITNYNGWDPQKLADTAQLSNQPDAKSNAVMIVTNAAYSAEQIDSLAKNFRPMLMIVNESIKKVGDAKVESIPHNTIAVSTQPTESEATRFVSLGIKPYKMSDELADLFAKKEAACKSSREMFAKLSVEQMNFKPANGTHTPRWNSEHMMGRELVFFSQIYNAVDPSIKVMDLNPMQMPKDYEYAHKDWTGKEESLQTQRVENFTRRFAYLLDGMDLKKKATGSRFWSPEALLKQMERHYGEHSANVLKKMELEGWPAK